MTGADEISDGFGGDLPFGRRAALILIDFMHSYFEAESPLCLPSRDSLNSASRLLEAARQTPTLVVHTRVIFGPEGIDGGVFMNKIPALRALIGPNFMNESMPEVAPRPEELVLIKQYASSFFGTTLASTLQAAGVDTLVISGVTTSGCVRATGVDAVQHGFIPKVVRDGCGDRGPGPHEANLYDLQAKYADVISEDEALKYFSSLSAR
ncbi:MAG: isochorismatase family protein [Acidimicrobiales bacterium]